MRIVFAGTPETALPSLEALVASDHDVVAVLTRPDAASGRGRLLHPSPVRQRAEELGIEVLTPRTPRDPSFQDRLRDLSPDCCAVVAYGALLPRDVLDIPRLGWINLHFSVLPSWRGAAPVQHAIMAGDDVTGASTFQIEEGLDSGPVFGVMTETIRPSDTAGDVLGRLAAGGAELLVATMDGLADGSLTAVPQATDGVSHAPKVESADAEVDWTWPAAVIDRRVRGCTPAPGAWTTFRGARLGLGPVEVVVDDVTGESRDVAPGGLVVGKHQVLVGTATGPVRLGRVRPPGKKEMDAADWARGARPQPGEVLGGR